MCIIFACFTYYRCIFTIYKLYLSATNRPQDLDPAIHRRFERSLLIAPPTFSDRKEIFQILLREAKIEDDFNFEVCAELTIGYTASDIFSVCKTAVAAVNRSLKNFGKFLVIR